MYEYQAVCIRVIDGDTFEMNVDLGFHVHVIEKVRLLGIDTPETHGRKKGSPEYIHGKQATDRAGELVFEEVVILRTKKDKTGKYGRFLADVILHDGRSLADVLREEGLEKKASYE